jgi:general secretion pathway protein K
MEVKKRLKRTLDAEHGTMKRSDVDTAHRSSFIVHRPSNGGSALIVVLWVTGLLAMLVASFAFEARIEARLTSYYRNRTKADYLARSGLEIAELIMGKSKGLAGTEIDDEKSSADEWYMYAKHLSDGVEVLVEHDLAKAGVGEGIIRVKITPEPALINVNMLTADKGDKSDRRWEAILEVGGIPEEMWAELIDSFYDWTDRDDAPRTDGAETDDYYEGLDKPYTARNGPLDTVGELRMIKGFTKAVVYGGVLESEGFFDEDKIQVSGIADMLTTYGDGRINVNAASRRVLMTLPEMDENLISLIEEERLGWTDDSGVTHDESFKDTRDFFRRIPEIDPAVKDMISMQSKVYRITSTGEINGVSRSLWCIVRYSGDNLTILRWREDD